MTCTCAEDFAASGTVGTQAEHGGETDLSWWCWMFGCPTCAASHDICGETK